MVEDVAIAPTKHYRDKRDPNSSGTRIRIYALTSAWSPSKLREIATDEFSKLTDPFVPESRYPINVSYNDEPVRIERFNDILFDYAHASGESRVHRRGGWPQVCRDGSLQDAGPREQFRLGQDRLIQHNGAILRLVTWSHWGPSPSGSTGTTGRLSQPWRGLAIVRRLENW